MIVEVIDKYQYYHVALSMVVDIHHILHYILKN